MSFWDNVFQAPAAQPSQPTQAPQPRAWWQNDDPYGQVQQGQQYTQQNYGQPQQGAGQPDLQKIRKRGHQNISAEEAEAIAEYDLANKPKYQALCDQCGSGNFILAGTRVAGVVMPTNKCFNCGNSARSPEPAVGGGSGKGSIHTRQIDTGGAGGQSMFGKFNGIPRSYVPRS
jgi:hypothetical protein